MSFSDPIADMLNRIRNAHLSGIREVEIPHSGIKADIVGVLKNEGYVADFAIEGQSPRKIIRIELKYHGQREPAIRGMRRLSKPGLRHYVKGDNLPRVLGGMGIAILSTSRGILTDRESRLQKVGGEVLCYVW